MANVFLVVVGFFLLLNLIFSLFLSYSDKDRQAIEPTGITAYAGLFLSEPQYIKSGYMLDCSGFTASFYKHFGIHLPASAKEQYLTFRDDLKIIKTGNLVFFAIGQSEVNHVGIMLNDSIFIHSPGKKKYVTKDNLNKKYWFNSCKGFANPIKSLNNE
ncbi:MAG TPA: hypothetical protein DDX98_07765 [Bacteroidales bacterium]|jgi:hypothetical protein|nr:hypothetical protein [Bacteroidales bacterium]